MSKDLQRVATLLHISEYDEALALLKQMLLVDPQNWNTLYLVGFTSRCKGDLASAKHYYDKALELRSDEPQILFALGIVEQQMGSYEQAVALLRKAQSIDPHLVEVYNSLGLTLKMMGKLNEALLYYSQGVDVLMDVTLNQISQSPEKSKFFGESKTQDGKIEMQLKPLIWTRVHELLKLNPLYATFKNNMGVCFAEQGDIEQARACYLEAIEFTPDGVNYQAPRIGLEKIDGS